MADDRRQQKIAFVLAAAMALGGCVGLEPEVLKTSPQRPLPQPASVTPRPRAAEATDPTLTRQGPRGRWTDDPIPRYEESEETTGVPGLPFPLLRRRASP